MEKTKRLHLHNIIGAEKISRKLAQTPTTPKTKTIKRCDSHINIK
ncbi:hypothetical protein EMIT0324P_170002 [Pseudomonas chlororaphis]